MKPKLTLDTDILLTLLLNECRLTRKQFTANMKRKYSLSRATHVTDQKFMLGKPNPKSGEEMYVEESIYDTGNYLVKTTKHGRVKAIERKAQVVTKPNVVIKKKKVRKIER